MKKLLAGLVTGLLMLGTAGVAKANLIVNGSFENPARTGNSWAVYTSIEGWATTSGPGIEIQKNVAGASYDGVQHVELDSHGNSAMRQYIDTVIGQSYNLTFAYSPRPGVSSGSNLIDVLWNTVSLTSGLGITGTGAANTVWRIMNFTVIGTGSNLGDSLVFMATGNNDSLGGYIDAVSLTPVPDPATMLLFGSGLIGLASALRRKIR